MNIFNNQAKSLESIIKKLFNSQQLLSLLSCDSLLTARKNNQISYDLKRVDDTLRSYIFCYYEDTDYDYEKFESYSTLLIDVIVPFDKWRIDGEGPRPVLIESEIFNILNNQYVDGVGTIVLEGSTPLTLDENYGGYTMKFSLTNGGDGIEDAINI